MRCSSGPGLFLVPLTIFMFVIFCIPIAGVVWTSVYDNGWTIKSYQSFATGSLFHKALWNTLSIGLSAGVVSVVLGYIVAYHLSNMSPRKRALCTILVMLPFWTSILVKSFAFTIILGTDGLINKALSAITGLDIALPLIFNRIGVIIGLTHWLLPFAVFPIMSSILAQEPSLKRAAEVMGAGPLRIFWKITFPLSLPGVVGGGLMASVIAMGSFVTPALLGGKGDLMMANLVDFYVREALDWSMASSIAIILIGIALLVLIIATRLRSGATALERLQ